MCDRMLSPVTPHGRKITSAPPCFADGEHFTSIGKGAFAPLPARGSHAPNLMAISPSDHTALLHTDRNDVLMLACKTVIKSCATGIRYGKHAPARSPRSAKADCRTSAS